MNNREKVLINKNSRNFLNKKNDGSITGMNAKWFNLSPANVNINNKFNINAGTRNDAKYQKPGTVRAPTNKYSSHRIVGLAKPAANGSPKPTLAAFAELWIPRSTDLPIEIWNVYTMPSYRRQGGASVLLKLIKTLYPNRNLWLSVVDVNSNEQRTFRSKIKLYAKSGFTSNTRLTDKSPSGTQMPSFSIGMIYKHTKRTTGPGTSTINKTVNKAVILLNANRLSQGSRYKFYKVRFIITSAYLKNVRDKVNNGFTEFAGTAKFSYVKFNRNTKLFTYKSEDNITKIRAGFYTSSGGGVVETTSANIPQNYLIMWHTHPLVLLSGINNATGGVRQRVERNANGRLLGGTIAYMGSFSGLLVPSVQDLKETIKAYFSGFGKVGINYIFAPEGIYEIALSTKFRAAIEKLESVIPNIAQFNAYFNPALVVIEEILSYAQTNPDRLEPQQLLDFFIPKINEVRFAANNSLVPPELYGVRIFKLKFTYWTSVANRDYITDATIYSKIVYETKKRGNTMELNNRNRASGSGTTNQNRNNAAARRIQTRRREILARRRNNARLTAAANAYRQKKRNEANQVRKNTAARRIQARAREILARRRNNARLTAAANAYRQKKRNDTIRADQIRKNTAERLLRLRREKYNKTLERRRKNAENQRAKRKIRR